MAGIEHGNIDNTIYIVFKRYYSAIVKYMETIHRKIPQIFFSNFDKGYYYDSKVHGKHTQENKFFSPFDTVRPFFMTVTIIDCI